MRVLALSDDPSVQSTIGTWSQTGSHLLRQITHIAEAQPALGDGPFDLVFVDAAMIGPATAQFARQAARSEARVIVIADDAMLGHAFAGTAIAVAERLALSESLSALPEPATAAAHRPPAWPARIAATQLALRHHAASLENSVLRVFGRISDKTQRRYARHGIVCDVPSELTTLELRGRLFLGLYERPEIALLRRYIDPSATVLELGGCLGVVACSINRRLRHAGRHIVLEAHPALCEYLARNRDRNGCGFGIRNAVISNRDTIDFYIRDPFIAGGSTVRMGSRKIAVPTTSVAAIERDHDLRFDTLFVDIEGGEQNLFRENPGFIDRLRCVIIEFHPKIIGRAACEAIKADFRAAGLLQRRAIGNAEAWQRP
jgi:FkbM family methyltransferase